ncbi:MAG: YdjC family protein [Ramlibacter sp.]|nr:YdjC family protein [Ramlibacter sp.]
MPGEQGRRLGICVDDFGLGEGVDQAVLGLARQGRISATSCMVGAPRWRADAPALREVDPAALDVGLHLDLTEFPFDARLRLPLQHWLARSHVRLVPRAALRREIEAQLDAFEQALGRPPAHVDGHQHVHQLPVVRDALLAALEARHGGRRPWLRRTRRPRGERVGGKAWLIETLGCAGLARLAGAKGYGQNGHLLGVYDFQGDAERYLALVGAWLRAAEDGDLLMCHPATQLVPGDAIAPARMWEYQVLAGPAFGALLGREGIQVGR